MKCKRCHVNISDVDRYCPRCGELFDNDDVKKIGNTLENELFNYYSDKTLGKKLSIGYLLFNFSYCFYKKMYNQGFFSFFATFIFLKLIKNILKMYFVGYGFGFLPILFSFVGSLVINIYYLINLNNLYLINSKYRIQKIINKYGKNKELLYEICKNDSRGNIFGAIASLVIFFIIYYA